MPIVPADLNLYAAANAPDTDAALNGGAIDTLRYLDYVQLAANDTIEAVSSAAGDTTQTVTVEARKADGSIVTETKTLTGTTAISFTTLGTVERVLKVELSAAAAGTVTIRRTTGAVTIRALPAGKRGFVGLFRKTASDPSVQRDYFTKGFWRNDHATLALQNAKVKQNADADARITHLLAVATGDVATSTNRLTAPAVADTQDPDTFDDTDKTVPGTNLGAATAIGVWFRFRLPAADAAHKYSYVSELAGETV